MMFLSRDLKTFVSLRPDFVGMALPILGETNCASSPESGTMKWVPFHVVVVVGGAGTPFMPGCYEYFFIALGLGLVFMASDLFLGRNLFCLFLRYHVKETATVCWTREANGSVVDILNACSYTATHCFQSPNILVQFTSISVHR